MFELYSQKNGWKVTEDEELSEHEGELVEQALVKALTEVEADIRARRARAKEQGT